MTIVPDTILPPCANAPEVYQHETLHHPPSRRDMTASEWAQFTERRAEVHRQCAGCPLMIECLYRAVVEVDVSGFVACTTERDRRSIRRELGIDVEMTPAAMGIPHVGGGPISRDSVIAIRQAYPKDTCLQLADRLGCSTSTIKRHLRRAREDEALSRPVEPATRTAPTVEAVLDCFDRLESSSAA
ncbi:MAG: WhiB family transcriptional regulator [Aeromicrobium sp.]